MTASISIAEALARSWDVVVIGTGMGGGMAGRRLAEAGLSVLFVEKGPLGRPTESNGAGPKVRAPGARLLRGLWPAPQNGTINGKTVERFGSIGCGVGGSSVFYAAALERPLRNDMDDLPDAPHPSGGWPAGFDTFGPFFDEAARYLHLKGEPDPLDPDPPLPLGAPLAMDEGDRSLMKGLTDIGLHPYALNLAIKRPERCRRCFGHKCPFDCKMDGRSAGVLPALATGCAALLTETEAVTLLAEAGRVSGLRVRHGDDEVVLRASTFVLAAGALNSPRLMLASGLGNSSGWVGRGLMFHLNEIFAVWPRGKAPPSTAKSIALRDFAGSAERFGMVQSMGVEVDYGAILNYIGQIWDSSPLARFKRLRKLLKIPAAVATRMFGSAGMFVGFLEDMPIHENRVLPPDPAEPDKLAFRYDITAPLRARRRAFRRAIKRGFRGHRTLFLRSTPQPNYGHPAGTLRFGTDPSTSVLDADCRAHDLSNLYVADASFMPTSLGVNPSLTIAANALRVADIIAARHQSRQAAE